MTQANRHSVLFVMWRSHGHLNASFGVAKRLSKLGLNAVYVGPSEIQQRVIEQGYVYYGCPAFSGLPFPIGVGKRIGDLLVNINNPSMLFSLIRNGRLEVKKVLNELPMRTEIFRNIVCSLRPDLLIFDPFLLYFYIPLKTLKINAVALSTKSLASRSIDVPPFTKSTIPTGSWLSRSLILAQWCIQFIQYESWDLYQRLVFGISPRSLCKELAKVNKFPFDKEWATRPFATDLRFESVPEWVLYCPDFDFPREKNLYDNAFYIGACVDLDRVETSFSDQHFLITPLIVCILTSVFKPGSAAAKRRNQFVRQILKCMKAMPEYTLILSLGYGLEPECINDCPPNVKIYESIPAISVLKHADLLITQGGGNIVKEAIMLGVKLLTFPDAADQPGLAARLKYHQISHVRPLGKVSANEIKTLILDTLSDSEKLERLMAMREKFLSYEDNDLPIHNALTRSLLKKPEKQSNNNQSTK